MIFGYPALWLHLLTILMLGMLGGMLITAIVVRLLMSRFPGYSLATRHNLLWLFALFPLIAGGTAVVLSFMPEWFPASDSWLAGIIHWHHAYLFSPTSWDLLKKLHPQLTRIKSVGLLVNNFHKNCALS